MKSYWLKITKKESPFLVLVEHFNFMDSKYYENQHILYIDNYLSLNNPMLKWTKQRLIKNFNPYLKKINSEYKKNLLTSNSFVGPFAQPVVKVGHKKLIPIIKKPLKNIYLANLDMVYPWDRGTNYAIEMGKQVAKLIEKS